MGESLGGGLQGQGPDVGLGVGQGGGFGVGEWGRAFYDWQVKR